jgi:very-short-patch-repair endonuclease
MIESKWQCKLTQRPNMALLNERGHVSKAALRVKDYLARVKGWEVVQELVVPNINPKQHPYLGDFYIVEKNLVVELDGCFHTPDKKPQEMKKDNQIREMGSDVLRIPFIIPSHLVYGHLHDPKYKEVKDAYHLWFDSSFCPQIVLAILRWELSKLKG